MFYGLPPPHKGLMPRISSLIKYIASKPLITTQNHMIALTSFLDKDAHKNYIRIKTQVSSINHVQGWKTNTYFTINANETNIPTKIKRILLGDHVGWLKTLLLKIYYDSRL